MEYNEIRGLQGSVRLVEAVILVPFLFKDYQLINHQSVHFSMDCSLTDQVMIMIMVMIYLERLLLSPLT